MKTIHAGTTPADDKVIVRLADVSTRTATEIHLTALKALSLATELINAANAVLEGSAK